MKYVFVETNFIVDVLRPFPRQDPERLLARHGKDVTLHVPWCCAAEAQRTLNRIIREDLAFIDGAGKFLGQTMSLPAGRGRPDASFAAGIQEFIRRGRASRTQALFDYPTRIEALMRSLSVIEPSPAVIARTLGVFPIKALTPFDEMVLGAVLEQAGALHAAGESAIYFCNLNKNDFAPTTGNELAAAYATAGIQYLDSFVVP